jgi:hypothetical protein
MAMMNDDVIEKNKSILIWSAFPYDEEYPC